MGAEEEPEKGEATENAPPKKGSWTFLSNHAHVLVCIGRDPDTRLRDVAAMVGLTERGVFKIITELEENGVITRHREGRRNHYEIHASVKLRHQLENNRTVGSLLEMLLEPEEVARLGLGPDENEEAANDAG